jgi:hypothetical protein
VQEVFGFVKRNLCGVRPGKLPLEEKGV